MDNPLIIATGLGMGFLLIVFLVTSRQLFTLLTAGYILFVPKLGILGIPGTSVSLRGEDLLIALLLVAVIFDLLGTQYALPSAAKKIAKWLLLLIPVGLIGTIVALQTGTVNSPMVAVLFLARKYEYFVLLLAGAMYFRNRESAQRSLLRLIVLSVWFNFGVAVMQSAELIGGVRDGVYYPDVSDRVLGMFAGPYELAAYFVMVLPLFMWQLFRYKHKLVAASGFVALFITLWMTQSRIALIAGVAVALFMSLAFTRNKLMILVLGVPSALIAWLVAPSPESTESRFDTLNPAQMWEATTAAYASRDFLKIGAFQLSSKIDDQSYAMRIDRWFNYYDGLIRYNPLFGLGPSAGGEAVDGNYVRVLFEFGIVGLAIFLVLLVTIARTGRGLAQGPYRAMVVWGGLGLLIQATFIDVFEASKVAEPFWLIFGVGLALAASQNPEVVAEPEKGNATLAKA